MIKILFFIEKLQSNGVMGGAEKVLINLVNGLDKEKFDVTVQTIYPDVCSDLLSNEVHYKTVFSHKSKINNLIMRIESELMLTYSMHIKGDYDIEVAYLETLSTKIMSGSTNHKAKKLAWVHCDLQNSSADPERFVKTTKKHYQKFDGVVCVSDVVRDSFRQLYGDIPKACTVYNTIDDAEIRNKAKELLPSNVVKRNFTVTLVGRLTPQKKIERLLYAHKRLLDEGIDHDVWIVGDGERREEIEEHIDRLGLNESVRLWGFQKNPYAFIAASDLLACSSIYEGYSTVITEGLILEKPIITTDVSGMRELLGDSEYGMITANDDEDFYRGMKNMLTDLSLLEKYTDVSNKRGSEFKKEKLIKDTEKFLLSIAEG